MKISRKNELPFDAHLSISRVYGGDEKHPINITVEDKTSGCRVLELDMSLEDFAKCLTGSSNIDAKARIYTVPIGYKSEHKYEVVARPKKYKDEKEVEKLLKPFEVDGWEARKSDANNHHRWTGDRQVSVLFSRFVNDQGEVWKR